MTTNKYVGLVIACVVVVIGVIVIMKGGMGHKAVIASGHPEWPPIMFQNGQTIDGAGPALVKKIFDEIGVQVSFPYSGAWDQVQAKAKTGEVDVLVAAYKNDERLTYMEYSDAYTTDPIVLFVGKGKAFPFTKWDDLLKRKGVAMTGDSYGQEFDVYSAEKLNLARAGTMQEALDMVASSTADYFIYSLYAGNVMLKNTNQVDKFESLPMQVVAEDFYITISKKSPFVKYMPQINQLIAKYKADGTTDQLVAQFKQAQ